MAVRCRTARRTQRRTTEGREPRVETLHGALCCLFSNCLASYFITKANGTDCTSPCIRTRARSHFSVTVADTHRPAPARRRGRRGRRRTGGRRRADRHGRGGGAPVVVVVSVFHRFDDGPIQHAGLDAGMVFQPVNIPRRHLQRVTVRRRSRARVRDRCRNENKPQPTAGAG